MAQFVAFQSGVEVNGETVLSIVDGMGGFAGRARTILSRCGIEHPSAGRWYRQQAWLDAFRAIADTLGPHTLFVIGTRIPENARFPPDIDTIEKALASIDVAYHMNHRAGEIGTYGYRASSSRSATMVCRNPYPCDFDRGIIYAVARRFKPRTSVVRVDHDDSAACRKKNADSCTYHVTW